MTDDWFWAKLTDLVMRQDGPRQYAYEATVAFPNGENLSHTLSKRDLCLLLSATGHREAAKRVARSVGGDLDAAAVIVGELVQTNREGLRVPGGLLDVLRYRITRWRYQRQEPTVHTLNPDELS